MLNFINVQILINSLPRIDKPASIVFRLLLAIFALYIYRGYPNALSDNNYITATVIWLFIYVITYNRDGYFSIVRLLNDSAFIFTFILGKSIDDFVILTFILLPIINSPNHSGDKQSWFLYLLTFGIIYFANTELKLSSILVPMAIMGIVVFMDYVRIRAHRIRTKILDKIDLETGSSYEVHKSFRLYESIISRLNNPLIKVKGIVCFIKNGDAPLMVHNSSEFVWNFKILREEEMINSANGYFVNLDIQINNLSVPGNVVVKFRKGGNFYFFLFVMNKWYPYMPYCWWFFGKFLSVVYWRLVSLFEFEKRLRSLEQDIVAQVKGKAEYIQNAEKALHFVRNKLSNLENLVQVFRDWQDLKPEVRMKVFEILYEKRASIGSSISGINQYATLILNKKQSPIHAMELKNYGIEWIYTWLRDQWITYFSELEMESIMVAINFQRLSKVEVNQLGVELLFNNWISNMKRYGSPPFTAHLIEDDHHYIVKLSNGYNPNENVTIRNLLSDFNSSSKNEILKRKSFGLLHVKELVVDMKMECELKEMDKMLILELKIKKTE